MKDRLNKKVLSVFFYTIFLFTFFCGARVIFAADDKPTDLFFSIPKAEIKEGEKITIGVKINSTKQPINAISGIFSFPADLVKVVSMEKEKSIFNIWTEEPKLTSNKISFEGVIVTPGFQNAGGLILHVTFEAKHKGTVPLTWEEGSVLANDGLGTNVLSTLVSTNFKIISPPSPVVISKPVIQKEIRPSLPKVKDLVNINMDIKKISRLPVITEYPHCLDTKNILFISGVGEPDAMTKITFHNFSENSFWKKIIDYFYGRGQAPSEMIVKNNKDGIFHYVSLPGLEIGKYSATPFLVNSNSEIPGLSVKFLVNRNWIVHNMFAALNNVGILVPIVFLGVFFYFIFWCCRKKKCVNKGETPKGTD